jgi:hypothetical protein
MQTYNHPGRQQRSCHQRWRQQEAKIKRHKGSNASNRSLDRQAGAGRSIRSASKATSAESDGTSTVSPMDQRQPPNQPAG